MYRSGRLEDMSNKQRTWALIGLWFLLGANIFAWQYIVQSGGDRVIFFDVGQGDAILMGCPMQRVLS